MLISENSATIRATVRELFRATSITKGHFAKRCEKKAQSKQIQLCSITRVDAFLDVHNVRFGTAALFKRENILCRAVPKSSSKPEAQQLSDTTPLP